MRRLARHRALLAFTALLSAVATKAAFAQPHEACSSAPSLSAYEDIGDDPALDLRIAEIRLRERKTLATDTLLYANGEGELYVPFEFLMERLDFPVTVDCEGRISGWFLREAQRVEIDPVAARASIAGTERALEQWQLVLVDGELHIGARTLQEWFLLAPDWDSSRQMLHFYPPYLLPSEEAARRGARGAGAGTAAQMDTTGFETIPERYRWIDWPYLTTNFALNAGSREGGVSVQGALLAEGDILKTTGRLAVTADTHGLASARFTLGRRDPLSRQLGPLGASIVELGDLAAPSTPLLQRNAFGVGLRIGREPLEQGGAFDTANLIGDAPPGWQAELFRDGQLLGFQTIAADGRYNFQQIPIAFGINRFTIELYGPSGEQQSIERVVDIAADLIQPGTLRYNLLLLREGYSLFEGRLGDFGEVDQPPSFLGDQTDILGTRPSFNRAATYLETRASYGISGNLGVNALAAYRLPDGGGPDTANLGAGFVLRTGKVIWGGDALLQQNGEMAGRLIAATSLGAFSLSASHERYTSGFRSNENEFGSLLIKSRSQVSVDGRIGEFGVGVSASRAERLLGGADDQVSLRMNGTLAGISLSNRLAYRRTIAANETSSGTERADGSVLAAGSIGPVRVRAGFDYDVLPDVGARRAVGEVSYRAAEWFLALRAERDLTGRGGQWGLAANRDWNGVRLGADVRYRDRSNDWRGFLTLSFALDRDPFGRGLRLGRDAMSNRGSIRASGFLDANANGKRDEGEEAVPNVDFEITPRGLSSHEGGVQVMENLPVDREIGVVPNLEEVDDPYLVAAQPGYLLTTRAGSAVRLDVPLIESGEIAVTLLAANSEPLANTVVALRACSVDTALQRERTAFDGMAFFIGLLPGCYVIEAQGVETQLRVRTGELAEANLLVRGEPAL